MNKRIKKLWVAALLSGEYLQGAGNLRNQDPLGNEVFCCLGVLCNLHAREHPEIAAAQTSKTKYMGNSQFPSWEVYAWANLSSSTTVKIGNVQDTLDEHNDNRKTFKQIAKAIDKQL